MKMSSSISDIANFTRSSFVKIERLFGFNMNSDELLSSIPSFRLPLSTNNNRSSRIFHRTFRFQKALPKYKLFVALDFDN